MKFKFSVILLCLFGCQFLHAQKVNDLMPLLNHRPVINKDTLVVDFKGKNNIKLSNYSDIDGDKLTFKAIGKASFGNIRRTKGDIIYEAYKSKPYSLLDSFSYEICDNYELCSNNNTYLRISGVDKEILKATKKAEAEKLKAIKKVEAEKLKAIKKAEAERLVQERKLQRGAEAALRAEQKAEAKALKAEQDKERQALRDKVGTAQADINTAVSGEDPLKAAKKRDAEIVKAAKQKELEALKAAKAKEREAKAALRAQQRAEAAAIAEGLVYEEETPKVKIEPIPPPPPNNSTSVYPNKTKNAVAKVLNRKRKKRKKNENIISLTEPQLSNCHLKFNKLDNNAVRILGFEEHFFFSHTSEILKESFKGEDYLVCNGSLSYNQDVIKLNVKFEIDSPYAQEKYGSIEYGSRMILKLINKEEISLISQEVDKGSLDRETNKTRYSTNYIFSEKDEKKLRENEIIGVRIYWANRNEEYEVNELDFLIDQFKCLDIVEEYGTNIIPLKKIQINKIPKALIEAAVDTEKDGNLDNSIEPNDSISNELNFPNIHFDLDKYYLKREFYSQLHDAANVMMRYPDIRVVVTGYTDARLPNQYNDVLSYKRAEKVISYLINNYGINRSRLILQYGSEVNPILTDFVGDYAGKDATEIGQYNNRRVEIRIAHDELEMERPAYDGDWYSVGLDTPSIGCSLGDCQYGYGEYHYAENRRYEGEWSNGKFEGEGTFTYETGEKYVGTWLANTRDGEGQFYDKKGKLVYDGNWKDDVQYGYGIYHYQNGTRYAGQWRNGEREGKGRFTIPGTGYYEGEFSSDKFKGYGTFYYSDRSKYEGDWLDNRKHGKGVEYAPDGSIYRQGTWENGDFLE